MTHPDAPISADAWTALARQLHPGARVAHLEDLPGGVSAQTTALTLEAEDGARRRVVVRRYDAAAGRRDPGADLTREHALLRSLHAAGQPVAEPLLLDAEGTLLGTPCLVLAFVERDGDGPALALRLERMAAQLAAIHALPTTALPTLPERLDPLPELFDWLPATPGMNAARSALAAHPDTRWRGPTVLLHGDFWPENLLWKEGRIAAVLDWEDAALGDPHADLAGARLELALAHDEAAAESFTRAYAARRPLDPGRLPLWELYVSSAMLHFLGGWGLPPERERVMRRRAERFLEGAARRLTGADPDAAIPIGT